MRNDLKSLTGPGANPGLALDRLVPWTTKFEKDDAKRHEFFKDVAKTKCDPAYADAFERWKALAKERKALVCTATLSGPLAVGLGNESPSEVGLTLHRIYGTPLIPGSAVKGACLRAIAGQDDAAKALFGAIDNAGYATFHDAWYVPDLAKGAPLQVDTVTVHHPLYYQSDGAKGFPTDFDDPTPVPFVSVKPGAQFLFALDVPAGWEDFAEKMLHHALTKIGLGGKTNAGYGWFKPWLAAPPPPPPSVEEQVWENCELRQKTQSRGFEIQVFHQGNQRLSLDQGTWTRLGMHAFGEKKQPRANVRVQRDGERWKVVEVKLL